jgi:hypothetical protein
MSETYLMSFISLRSMEQQGPLTQAPVAYGRGPVSAQEVFMFFSDPSQVIRRVKRALLGNCDFILKDGNAILIEWITEEKDGTFVKTWLSPPKNLPLVKNATLWQTIEGMLNIYCNPYFLLNKPDEPEDLATTIGIDFTIYLADNWNNFQLDIASAHAIRTMVCDEIYGVIKGSEGGGYHKILNTVFQYTYTEKKDEEQQIPTVKGILGMGQGDKK